MRWIPYSFLHRSKRYHQAQALASLQRWEAAAKQLRPLLQAPEAYADPLHQVAQKHQQTTPQLVPKYLAWQASRRAADADLERQLAEEILALQVDSPLTDDVKHVQAQRAFEAGDFKAAWQHLAPLVQNHIQPQ